MYLTTAHSAKVNDAAHSDAYSITKTSRQKLQKRDPDRRLTLCITAQELHIIHTVQCVYRGGISGKIDIAPIIFLPMVTKSTKSAKKSQARRLEVGGWRCQVGGLEVGDDLSVFTRYCMFFCLTFFVFFKVPQWVLFDRCIHTATILSEDKIYERRGAWWSRP